MKRFFFFRWGAAVLLCCSILMNRPIFAQTSPDPAQEQSAANHPLAADLPPCPQAVPCRVEDDAGDKPAATQTSSKNLLPCPMSVPCYVPEGQSIELPRESSTHRVDRPRPLHFKVTSPDESADLTRPTQGAPSDQKIVEQAVPASSAPTAADAAAASASMVPPAAASAKDAVTARPAPASDLKTQAEQAQHESDATLVSVEASSFTLDQAMLYNQASDTARESRQALEHHDYAKALTLSRQAKQMAEQVIAMQKSEAAKASNTKTAD